MADAPRGQMSVAQCLPARLAVRYRLAPLRLENGVLVAASSRPYPSDRLEELAQAIGLPLQLIPSSEEEIQEGIRRHYGIGAETVEAMLQSEGGIQQASPFEEAAEDLERIGGEASAIQVVNQLLAEAVNERATDVHLEPSERAMAARFRIDGVLYDVPLPPQLHRFYPALLSRIKVMANLNVAERRLPQDGRAKVRANGRNLDLRISILPTPEGETAVIRLLNTNIFLGLEQLGLLPDHQRLMEGVLTRPHGILLVTGPTGSGKTTTLYASLCRLNDRTRKILTIEDPIEYRLPGTTQMQVHPKIEFTFARALRSMLRHDPDIMMVGEIRDLETAEIAIRTALTGHLVFSTLHTNDAAGSVTRLVDMGLEPYLVSSSLECAVAQRLVRLLCPSCKGSRCGACRMTGYQGRTALFEFLMLDEEIRRLIVQQAPAHRIKAAARRKGMRTLREDGLLKAAQGLTSEVEVLRVTQADE